VHSQAMLPFISTGIVFNECFSPFEFSRREIFTCGDFSCASVDKIYMIFGKLTRFATYFCNVTLFEELKPSGDGCQPEHMYISMIYVYT
jgi:hypothetical protein